MRFYNFFRGDVLCKRKFSQSKTLYGVTSLWYVKEKTYILSLSKSLGFLWCPLSSGGRCCLHCRCFCYRRCCYRCYCQYCRPCCFRCCSRRSFIEEPSQRGDHPWPVIWSGRSRELVIAPPSSSSESPPPMRLGRQSLRQPRGHLRPLWWLSPSLGVGLANPPFVRSFLL